MDDKVNVNESFLFSQSTGDFFFNNHMEKALLKVKVL